MLFFTDEKYQNGTAFCEYEAHCKSIWNDIPIGIHKLLKGMLPPDFDPDIIYGLHDGRINNVDLDKQKNEISIHFTIYDDLENASNIMGIYKDAEIIAPVSDYLINGYESPECDIMCHEITIRNDGNLCHTVLFAAGEELSIVFSSFELIS
jgi:hypothetical protein